MTDTDFVVCLIYQFRLGITSMTVKESRIDYSCLCIKMSFFIFILKKHDIKILQITQLFYETPHGPR